MRLAAPLALLTALCAGCLAAPFAQAGFAPDNEPIVRGEQLDSIPPALDGAGNATFVWKQELPGGVDVVTLQRLSAGGVFGPQLDVAPGENGVEPAVGVTASGDAFVVWEVGQGANGEDGARGRWVAADGSMGPVLPIVTGKEGERDVAFLAVVVDPAGVATVAWKNVEVGNDLELRRVARDGSLGALVPDVSGGAVNEPRVAALPNGSTVVVWRATKIQSAVVDTGLKVSPPQTLSSLAAASPRLAVGADGRGFAFWRGGLAEYGLFGHQLDASGAPLGEEIVVSPLSTEFVNRWSVSADSGGDFLLSWDRQAATNKRIVFARGFSFEGGFTGPAQPLSATPELDASAAVTALFDDGRGVAVWRAGEAGERLAGIELGAAALPTGPVLLLDPDGSYNLVEAATAPALGVSFFFAERPVSGSAQETFVRRFLVPPTCADSGTTVQQGRQIAVPITCTGPAIEAATLLSPPRHGVLGAYDPVARAFSYTPVPGFEGTDSFSYAGENDGGASNPATVTIAVGKDTVKPRVKKLRLLRKGKPGKQRFRFRLVFSEPATARLTLKRVVRVGGKAKLRKVGRLVTKQAGTKATVAVKGKLARKLRAGGRFRVVAVATDLARNKSAPKKRAFRVR